MYMEEHNVLRSMRSGFYVYDSRGFNYGRTREALEELSSWMSEGVHRNQLCLRYSDCDTMNDDMENDVMRSSSNHNDNDVQHGLKVHKTIMEERIDCKLKICECLDSSETDRVYDIVCLTEYRFLIEEVDPVSPYALTEVVYRALLISDKGHIPRKKFQDWALLILAWLVCSVGVCFSFVADICSKLGEKKKLRM
ncbi:hypothetical protein V6N13_004789 [Hibiscus sabdariffa]|uniref:Uncharacterized protein n=1 Tax=Hibiscus sabdariffa TaxID=183260 RepID=A0ABR2RZJ4_9ROSI